MRPTPSTDIQRRLLVVAALTALFLMVYKVIAGFVVPVAWAGILAYVSWPWYTALRQRLPGRDQLSAVLMTSLLSVVLVLPLIWVVLMMDAEISLLYRQISARLAQGPVTLPPWLHNLPVLGNTLETFINNISGDPEVRNGQLKAWAEVGLQHLGGIADLVGKNIAKMVFAIFTLFFFYRDGDELLAQIRRVLYRGFGERIEPYLGAMGNTTRAVVTGLGLTAMIQGVLAGLGYWVGGVPSPVFLGMITTIVALIPFGPLLGWGGVVLWLLGTGHLLAAAGLGIWGIVVVSWVDNFVRPMLISKTSQIPFLLVLFGVLGGLGAFGMIGLFLGPVILALAMAVWREWLETSSATNFSGE